MEPDGLEEMFVLECRSQDGMESEHTFVQEDRENNNNREKKKEEIREAMGLGGNVVVGKEAKFRLSNSIG